MRYWLWAMIAALLGLVQQVYAAELWPPPEVERLAAELMEQGESEGSVAALLDDLSKLWLHPVDLRRVPVAQMRSLPLIAPGEAERIAQFLQANPEVQAIEAVGLVLGMPAARRQLFAMFYTINGALPRLDSTLRRRLQGDLVQRFGYSVPLYRADAERMNKVYGNTVGKPLALQFRAVASTGDGIAFGVKGIKRPGEPFFYAHAPQGFPYYSAYLQLQGSRFVSPKVVLGDFSAEFGTGQTVGSQLMLFRTQSPYAWGKLGAGVRGRLGSGDNSTLRGIALQHQPIAWLSYAVALSAQPITASLAPENHYPGEKQRIATILSQPVYAKQREAARRFNAWEFAVMANVQVTIGAFCLGYSAIALHYNRNFASYEPSDFRLPHPQQTHMRNGLSLHLYLDEWRIWGEVTLSSPLRGGEQQYAVSGIAGVTFAPSYLFSVGAQGYYYPHDASPRYAHGIISSPQNRAGAILSASLRISEAASLTLGGELRQYLNPKVMRAAPALTWRGFAEGQYVLPQGSIFDARYRYWEHQSVRSEKTYSSAAVARIHEVRLRANYKQAERLSLRASALYAYRDGKGSAAGQHNWAVAQDVRLFLLARRLIFTGSAALYDCRGDGIVLALYEYAPLYSMAMSRFSKKGWRAYGMVYWEFYRGLGVTFKAACTQLLGESLAALTELEQQRRNMLELTAQLRWRF